MTGPAKVLGLSCFYHDSSACLMMDGRVAAAAQEERFTRRKNESAFPIQAVGYCLREGGLAARSRSRSVSGAPGRRAGPKASMKRGECIDSSP